MGLQGIQGLDLKLLLLSGETIKVGNFGIKPYTLREIARIGYSKYMSNLQFILMTVDDFVDSVTDLDKRVFLETERHNLKAFDFYTKFGGESFIVDLIESLKIFLRTEDVHILDDDYGVAVGFFEQGIFYYDEDGELLINNEKLEYYDTRDELKIVHRGNFDEIVSAIKLQNYIEKVDVGEVQETEAEAVDEDTKALMEQMKRNEQRVEEIKKRNSQYEDEDEQIDIGDIISAISAKSHSINKLNIWDITIYQLYDEYGRLELIDSYDFSIRAMMAGAEKIDLRHWSSRL
jgi:hypothetical protein